MATHKQQSEAGVASSAALSDCRRALSVTGTDPTPGGVRPRAWYYLRSPGLAFPRGTRGGAGGGFWILGRVPRPFSQVHKVRPCRPLTWGFGLVVDKTR